MTRASTRPPFPGLQLSARDRQSLADQTRERRAVSARTWKRIRMLELLHAQWTLADIAEALGTYPREVRRVGWRYVERGVQAALTDDPRPPPRSGWIPVSKPRLSRWCVARRPPGMRAGRSA